MFTCLLKVQLETNTIVQLFLKSRKHPEYNKQLLPNVNAWGGHIELRTLLALIYRPAIRTSGDVTDDVACLELGKNPTVELLLNAS